MRGYGLHREFAQIDLKEKTPRTVENIRRLLAATLPHKSSN